MAKKILIVEDNDVVAALLGNRLKHHGFEVVVAPDAVLGAKVYAQQQPDLVILDLLLPAGGGIAVLRAMRELSYGKNTPVIVLTGTKSSALKQIVDLGVQDVVQKPYDAKDLMTRILKVLGEPDPKSSE